MLDRVEMTSDGFTFLFIREVKIAAKASLVTVFGKLMVRDIGRWSEKKAEAQISDQSSDVYHTGAIGPCLRRGDICCVLGTLGRL